MKRALQVTLGIVTSIGGFLEIGSITTAAQAGSAFGYQLIWSIVLGVLCIAFLVEMAGRFAACSGRTIPDALRERFGTRVFVAPLVVMLAVSICVLVAELGGAAAALELATGVKFPVWAIPLALLTWGILWRATFGVVENGVSILGLVTLMFGVAALKGHPDYHAIVRGVVPTLPHHDAAHYWFVAVSVLGASISPYLYYFYCSGAIEEKWDASYLTANKVTAAIGMGFGGILSIAVLVLAAMLFNPAHKDVSHFQDLPSLVTPILGNAGFWLFVASLGIACLGATLEIALSLAYMLAQSFGWRWGEDLPPRKDLRFSMAYTVAIALAVPAVLLGVDPLKVTEIGMALTAATLPAGVLPFLILMNDKRYLGTHVNRRVGNAIVIGITVLSMILAVVSIPLEIIGSS